MEKERLQRKQREKWSSSVGNLIKCLNNVNADNVIIGKFQDYLELGADNSVFP